MKVKTVRQVKAFDDGAALDFEAPVSARERFVPLAAVTNDQRTLNIFGEIGDRGDGTGITTGYVQGALKRMGAGDIQVNMNTPGGDFFTGLAIYNMLREHDGKVTTNVLGLAASAGSVIAMASDMLNIAKAGFLMIHNAWGVVIGNKADLTKAAEILGQFDAAMAGVYADRSGMAVDHVVSLMDAETFFSGEDAVSNGLADNLLPADQVVPQEETKQVAALRRADVALAKAGYTRSERRALLSELNGDTPGAISDRVTPRADVLAILNQPLFKG